MNKKMIYREMQSVLAAAFIFAGCARNMEPLIGYCDIPEETTMLDITNYYKLTEVPGRIAMIEFYSPTCTPCIKMDSVIARLGERYKKKALVGKVNVRTDDTIQYAFSIQWTPTFIFLNSGKEIRRVYGVYAEDSLAAIIDSLLISVDSQ
jgi:thioredoxin 1